MSLHTTLHILVNICYRGECKIYYKKAIEKANNEYEKFRIKQDREYVSSMDEMYRKYLEENDK